MYYIEEMRWLGIYGFHSCCFALLFRMYLRSVWNFDRTYQYNRLALLLIIFRCCIKETLGWDMILYIAYLNHAALILGTATNKKVKVRYISFLCIHIICCIRWCARCILTVLYKNEDNTLKWFAKYRDTDASPPCFGFCFKTGKWDVLFVHELWFCFLLH